jgi:hypothetical protein
MKFDPIAFALPLVGFLFRWILKVIYRLDVMGKLCNAYGVVRRLIDVVGLGTHA